MKILNEQDIEFPEDLKKIKPIVKKIHIQGDIQNFYLDKIAIIGSRDCTTYGMKVAYEFGYKLAKAGLCIVSGMALGIDKYAHLGTLDAGGKTIAVLGGGFKHIYPEQNIGLYRRILEEGGTAITEHNPDELPNGRNFPKRNRIVSGISLGVLVVEAEHRSGTSITVQYAKTQGKKIFCIPSNIDSTKGVGTNRLIKEGAKLVTNINDILEEISNPSKAMELQQQVPKKYQEIYNLIQNGTHELNSICRQLKRPLSQIMPILTMMEIEGHIESTSGQEFIIKREK